MQTFISIIRAVLRRWKFWTILPLVSMAIVFLLTMSLPKKYISEATLNINFQNSKELSLTDDVMQQYEINLYFENMIQLARSNKNIEIARLKAMRDFYQGKYSYLKEKSNEETPKLLRDSVRVIMILDSVVSQNSMLDLKNPEHRIINQYLKDHDLSFEAIENCLKTSRIGNSNFIKISFEADGPLKAAYMTGLIIESVVGQYKKITKNRSVYDREMFERLVNRAKSQLDQKVDDLEKYKVENNIINLGEHTKAIVNQLVNMEIQLSHLKEQKAAGQRAVSKIKESYNAGGEPLPLDVSGNERIIALKQELKKLNNQLLQNRFKPSEQASNNEESERKIDELKKLIGQEVTKLVTDVPYDPRQARQEMVMRLIGYELDVEMADESIPIIEKEVERITNYASRFAPIESGIGAMNDEIYVAQQSYLILLNKLNLAKSVEMGTGEGEVTIVDEPTIPLKPEASKRALLIIVSGFGVFVVIVGIFVLINVLDASISTVEKFEKVSFFNVIAAIPDMMSESVKRGLIQPRVVDEIMNEQIKSIRKAIIDLPEDRRKVLWLCGHRAEGKQWLASRVAMSMIKLGYKVLVLQADPLDGKQTRMPTPIIGEGVEVLKTCTESGIVSLASIPMSPFEMMTRDNWILTISDLKKRYNFIFTIVTPLETSSDWREWMDISQAGIYVFRANKIFQTIDRRAMEAVKLSGLNIVGAVLNKIDVEHMESYIGHIPKTRSKLRMVIKKLVKRDFREINEDVYLKSEKGLNGQSNEKIELAKDDVSN
ncbi:MAG: hypothetical protein HGB11_05080 [Chlorobiales bacterium]|nr:hypothetical protein [Chlorobiales bacterium]